MPPGLRTRAISPGARCRLAARRVQEKDPHANYQEPFLSELQPEIVCTMAAYNERDSGQIRLGDLVPECRFEYSREVYDSRRTNARMLSKQRATYYPDRILACGARLVAGYGSWSILVSNTPAKRFVTDWCNRPNDRYSDFRIWGADRFFRMGTNFGRRESHVLRVR